MRDLLITTNSALEKAAIFIYLNRNAFNGLCRYSKKGLFNTPFGRYKTVYFPEVELRNIYTKRKDYTFLVTSFENIMQSSKENDVIYVDPPYVPLNDTAYFTAYTKESFGPMSKNFWQN